MSVPSLDNGLGGAFETSARKPSKRKRKRPSPLSLRLSADERAALEKVANGMALSRYIKGRIFDSAGRPKPSRRPQPLRDHAGLAQALGLLGAMDLADSLRALSKAAEIGALPVTPETEDQITTACAAVIAIKSELMRALGFDDGNGA